MCVCCGCTFHKTQAPVASTAKKQYNPGDSLSFRVQRDCRSCVCVCVPFNIDLLVCVCAEIMIGSLSYFLSNSARTSLSTANKAKIHLAFCSGADME